MTHFVWGNDGFSLATNFCVLHTAVAAIALFSEPTKGKEKSNNVGMK